MGNLLTKSGNIYFIYTCICCIHFTRRYVYYRAKYKSCWCQEMDIIFMLNVQNEGKRRIESKVWATHSMHRNIETLCLWTQIDAEWIAQEEGGKPSKHKLFVYANDGSDLVKSILLVMELNGIEWIEWNSSYRWTGNGFFSRRWYVSRMS